MDLNSQKGRYGVAYLRNICAQSGYGMSETSPGEDAMAIDCKIECYSGDIRVQVKCTEKDFTSQLDHLSMPVEDGWKEKWSAYGIYPAYFLVVRVPRGCDNWIVQNGDHTTLHQTAAYWTKIDVASIGSSIKVSKSKRFTSETVSAWENELLRLNGLFADVI